MGSAEDSGVVRLPQLRLDELLEELQARIDAARGTRDRVHHLLEAVLSVGRELDLEGVLQRIVEAAAALVDAEYAALGVISEDGKGLVKFLTVGLSEEEIAAIGPYPAGHGILGELIRNPEPLRLAKLSDHSASYGFPANHPPMNSFAGTPIRVRGKVFGNLYLTEKRGGGHFDDEDEAVLSTLAVAAGVAIDNARLYEESRQRERWLRASGEVTYELLSGRPRGEVLGRIAERAREITSSVLAVVALPVGDGTNLSVELAIGRESDVHRGLVLPIDSSLCGLAFREAVPVTSADSAGDPRVSAGPERFVGLGPAVAVPIGTATGVRGVLLLVREKDRLAFSDQETEPLLGFAGQAAVAMELAERQQDAEQIALLEDRDRIARDLHDLAIQRLFATGMTLQSAARFIEHEGASERVVRAVGDLDETIKIIRSTIFGLRSRQPGEGHNLRARIAQAVGEIAGPMGFPPSLRMEGLLDTQVPRQVADHAVAVLGEALSNAARHAQATRTDVAVKVTATELVLSVSDNGVGIPAEEGRRSGLRNLTERAEQLGGSFELTGTPGGGTTVTWRVPLETD
ncbi:GAF domain-containing protein [Streptomyces sp. WAC 00631]|uniref:sensor histidine kinase n=1 Tax=unclassified Streptomyces TaxID=2593676 RepID=UPI000F791AD2|nr:MULTISPECIES: GAF domain-containing protein [unclassified Streptomyces]MCC5036989.1 GAF domain-containing protein [Streptomyces sp. WAC 00631]MCC9737881.1 GAF domain-containing protein [Streptomyces sp. MNU89]